MNEPRSEPIAMSTKREQIRTHAFFAATMSLRATMQAARQEVIDNARCTKFVADQPLFYNGVTPWQNIDVEKIDDLHPDMVIEGLVAVPLMRTDRAFEATNVGDIPYERIFTQEIDWDKMPVMYLHSSEPWPIGRVKRVWFDAARSLMVDLQFRNVVAGRYAYERLTEAMKRGMSAPEVGLSFHHQVALTGDPVRRVICGREVSFIDSADDPMRAGATANFRVGAVYASSSGTTGAVAAAASSTKSEPKEEERWFCATCTAYTHMRESEEATHNMVDIGEMPHCVGPKLVQNILDAGLTEPSSGSMPGCKACEAHRKLFSQRISTEEAKKRKMIDIGDVPLSIGPGLLNGTSDGPFFEVMGALTHSVSPVEEGGGGSGGGGGDGEEPMEEDCAEEETESTEPTAEIAEAVSAPNTDTTHSEERDTPNTTTMSDAPVDATQSAVDEVMQQLEAESGEAAPVAEESAPPAGEEAMEVEEEAGEEEQQQPSPDEGSASTEVEDLKAANIKMQAEIVCMRHGGSLDKLSETVRRAVIRAMAEEGEEAVVEHIKAHFASPVAAVAGSASGASRAPKRPASASYKLNFPESRSSGSVAASSRSRMSGTRPAPRAGARPKAKALTASQIKSLTGLGDQKCSVMAECSMTLVPEEECRRLGARPFSDIDTSGRKVPVTVHNRRTGARMVLVAMNAKGLGGVAASAGGSSSGTADVDNYVAIEAHRRMGRSIDHEFSGAITSDSVEYEDVCGVDPTFGAGRAAARR